MERLISEREAVSPRARLVDRRHHRIVLSALATAFGQNIVLPRPEDFQPLQDAYQAKVPHVAMHIDSTAVDDVLRGLGARLSTRRGVHGASVHVLVVDKRKVFRCSDVVAILQITAWAALLFAATSTAFKLYHVKTQ